MATGSKSSTVLSENAELMALLTSINKTMKAMSSTAQGKRWPPNRQTLPNEVERPIMVPIICSAIQQSRMLTSFWNQQAPKNPRWRRRRRRYLPRRDRTVNEWNWEEWCENFGETRENRLCWLNKLSDGQLNEKTEKYLPPANCDNFITPEVNPKIWERLDHQTQGRDLKLSTLQSTNTKVGYVCTKATKLLLQARRENKSPDIEQWIRMHTDALGLLGHISYEISHCRRDAIRPNLSKEYATLCASHVPITKMLFGEELQTQLNHIQASNKISNTTSTQGGNKGYSKQRGSSYWGSHSTTAGRNFLGTTSQTSQQSNHGWNNQNYSLRKEDNNNQK